MKTYRSAIWLNFGVLLLVIALVIGAKLFGSSASTLFRPPSSPRSPDERLLTHTFQILCTVPVICCAFSWGILRILRPGKKMNRFILASALLMGGFLINEIFRVHIIFLQAGVPKLVTCAVYAAIFGYYGFAFRRIISSTPYLPLALGMGLLFAGIVADSFSSSGSEFSILLEGVPKLLSEVNVALYFWWVCHREILRSRLN